MNKLSKIYNVQIDFIEPQEECFYTVDAVCKNCNAQHTDLKIAKGISIDDTLCPNCDCKSYLVAVSKLMC